MMTDEIFEFKKNFYIHNNDVEFFNIHECHYVERNVRAYRVSLDGGGKFKDINYNLVEVLEFGTEESAKKFIDDRGILIENFYSE